MSGDSTNMSTDDEEPMTDMAIDDDESERSLVIGKIAKIHLENFLTHAEVKVHPSELLNIVIGPNGTGKSSLVAGIIIGMGGSTKILSARNRLSDYVKNGKERAKITIGLFRDEQRNQTQFCREFGRDNKSIYTIDRRKVTEKDYLEQISQLNIQVGNLCQFLPQERVQDFAKQNPQELFLSTLQSVCTDDSIEHFNQLKELRSHQLDGSKQSASSADQLQQNERRVEILRGRVAEIQRQDQLVKRRSNIEKKLAWMEFSDLYKECKKVDNDLKVATKHCEDVVKTKNDLMENIKNVASERKMYETLQTKEMSKKTKTLSELDRIHDDFDKLENDILRTKTNLQAIEQAAKEKEQQINENAMVLATHKKEYTDYLASVTSVEAIQAEITQMSKDIADVRLQIVQLEQQRSEVNNEIDNYIRPNLVRIETRLKSMESLSNAKLMFLREKFPETYRAVMWLRNNKDRSVFVGHIYEPMMLEMNIKANEYSQFIENTVKNRDLIAFVCEEAEDVQKLLSILKDEENLNQVNVVQSPKSAQLRYKSRVPLSDVRKYGGEIYMVDCIDAPFPILNYLCLSYQMHEVLIGNENLDRKFESLPDELRLVFSPTNRIIIKISKYSNQKSTMSVMIKPKNWLNNQISKREMDELKSERQKIVQNQANMYNKRNGIEAKMNAMEATSKDMCKQKNECQKKLHTLEDLKRKVKHQLDVLNRSKNEIIDFPAEKEKSDAIVRKSIQQMFHSQEKAAKIYETYMQIDLDVMKARDRLKIYKNSTMNYDIELENLNEEITKRKGYCDRIGQILDKTKKDCKDKQIAAMQLTDNKKPTDADFPYKQAFDELPSERDVLLEEVDDLTDQINERSSEDQRILNEYDERRELIKRLRTQMSKLTKSTDDVNSKINGLHNGWYPKISAIMNSINGHFSRFMGTMGCAGEIELVHDEVHNYVNYGIEIRVKYRNTEQLRPLDRFVQSGGERAVAIAVYSLSLQHLSQVPFRCVDEINQGMDPNNERRIFEMLVNNVAQPGQSQFFYVTPKLQPNLPFNENTSCLTVFNGAYVDGDDHFEEN